MCALSVPDRRGGRCAVRRGGPRHPPPARWPPLPAQTFRSSALSSCCRETLVQHGPGAELVGTDKQGNKYFEKKDAQWGGFS